MITKPHTLSISAKYAFLFYLQCVLFAVCSTEHATAQTTEGLPLYYWHENKEINFGDYISVKIVDKILGKSVKTYETKPVVLGKKLLGLGSILYFGRENDVVWGSGVNGKRPYKWEYSFKHLDVRAVRGPLTRAFLKDNFDIDSPEIYGDPALLFPYLFPEFKKNEFPTRNYIIIPNYNDEKFFPRNKDPHVVYPTDPWDHVIRQILDSQFVISSSLHGLVIAEAYGIPARFLRVSEIEPMLKYQDYYFGTNRPDFKPAYSIDEALLLGGEPPFSCDLKKLYEAFPFEFWPSVKMRSIDFPEYKPLL